MKQTTIFLIMFIFFVSFASADNFYNKPVSKEKMRLLPVPKDFRNYFLLQSIDNDTYIIIGDFSGPQKFITRITDKNSDNTIDGVIEYYPDTKKMIYKKKPANKEYYDLKKIKKDIIEGTIFRENYSYKMKSIDVLKYKLKQGTDIFPFNIGFNVKFFDQDAPTSIMSEFLFSKIYKEKGRYNLIFKTNYYKLYKLKIMPPIKYSVFCKNSKDPVVAETVEELLKMISR